jgi:hypothetical protein
MWGESSLNSHDGRKVKVLPLACKGNRLYDLYLVD